MVFKIANKTATELYEEHCLAELERAIHTNFIDQALLIKALSHGSPYSNPLTSKKENRRLGLIGDKLIDLVLFDKLYRAGIPLMEMDSTRQATSKKEVLNLAARNLGLKPYLFYNDGTEERVKEMSCSLFEDSIEAIVGAIYLDQGFTDAVKFVNEHLIKK
jgi:ribonuclease-3